MSIIEQIIESIALSTTNTDFTTASMGGVPKGLQKIADLRGLDRNQINYLYAIYLNQRPARTLLHAHLSYKFTLPESYKRYQLGIVRGAVKAVEENGYRSVDCYKCHAKGCDMCNGTGKRSRKPKEYQLCNVARSTWYNKNMATVREMYDSVVDYLYQIESQIVAKVKENRNSTK